MSVYKEEHSGMEAAKGTTFNNCLLNLAVKEFITHTYTATHLLTKSTMVTQLKSASEYDNALASGDKLVVVDFFATWCGPCKMIAPMIEKFAEHYSDASFYKLDVDEVSDVAQKAEVSSMPTLVFYKGGKEVTRVVGANPAAIKQAIASNV
ncbi:hypothetical protein SEUBUCD646_0G04580 [Saccharomyces eubayanus]|uniref:Thioredoxin domain-containing protein n=1 Tax=Saccharomyces eubayanus TaxID=1080349 RepID=A0ABN8VQK5_SACEU|nr:hypothetical protein SEUBUCD650_0G04570 [Saccharomyces eubayanus]CAI2028877.1 hypothetical protein SEUBUCD646_0G04580 [Saccharomyces eubayanus]